MISAPCKDCPDRVVEPNCHMTCERYKEFQTYRQAIIDSRKNEREYRDYRMVIQHRIDKSRDRMRKQTRFTNRMN